MVIVDLPGPQGTPGPHLRALRLTAAQAYQPRTSLMARMLFLSA